MNAEKIHPVDHGVAMYDVMRGQGLPHEQALFRAIVLACWEERGRCRERCEELSSEILHMAKRPDDNWSDNIAEGARKDAEAINKMSPPNLDWKTGILR